MRISLCTGLLHDCRLIVSPIGCFEWDDFFKCSIFDGSVLDRNDWSDNRQSPLIDLWLKSDCKMRPIGLQSMEGMYNRGLGHDCNGFCLIVLDCSTIGVSTIGFQSVSIVSIVPQSKICYNCKWTRLEHDCLIVSDWKLPYIPDKKNETSLLHFLFNTYFLLGKETVIESCV